MQQQNDQAFVDIKQMSVRYGKLIAVDKLDLAIPKGEVFGYIGPNGAGKSSTMKVLATLLKPWCGAVKLGGIDVIRNPGKIRPRIGYMPDFFGVYDDLTVEEYLHFFAATYRIQPYVKRKSIVGDVLELTDLRDKVDSPVDSLSRGMKQRLGVARVLLHDPDFLILDEPASGLDPRARIEMRELLKELRNMGKTIMISSHILSELAELCTRIGIVEGGKLVAEGSLDEIYKRLHVTRTIHVQITNLTEEMRQKIASISGVREVRKQLDRLELHVEEENIAAEELLSQLIATGAKVRMFQPEAMDLETVFMKLTEGKVS